MTLRGLIAWCHMCDVRRFGELSATTGRPVGALHCLVPAYVGGGESHRVDAYGHIQFCKNFYHDASCNPLNKKVQNAAIVPHRRSTPSPWYLGYPFLNLFLTPQYPFEGEATRTSADHMAYNESHTFLFRAHKRSWHNLEPSAQATTSPLDVAFGPAVP